MTHAILGIDIAKAKYDVALIHHERVMDKQFENTLSGYQQLNAWLKKQGIEDLHICLEATGQYGDGVAQYLFEQSYSVSVVNPARIKHYANSKLRRNKTDKADAQLIAEYCLREKPALWTPPPAIFKDLQAMTRHLEDLLQSRQQQTNRLSSGVHTPAVIKSLELVIACFNDQIKQIKADIQAHIDQHPELRRQQDLLVSIPGIGKLSASKLLGEIRNVTDFEDARQLSAYAGLTPRNVSSGTSVHKKARLSKTGNANLRKILYMPAISAKHHNPIVSQFCDRLLHSGLRPMEVIAAAMHKLLHLIFGILKTGRPFDPNYLPKLQVLS